MILSCFNVFMWEPCFCLYTIHLIEVHNNGNVFIKSYWFIIWTSITFIWPSFSFNIQIWNKQFFYYIFYLLDNHLSFFELKQNNMAHLNPMFIIEYKKNPTMLYSRIKSKFFVKAWSQMNTGMWQKWHEVLIWEVCEEISLQYFR